MFFAKFPYINYNHLAGNFSEPIQHGASSYALAVKGKDTGGAREGDGVFWPCYRTARYAIEASPRPDLIREGESTRGYHEITIQKVKFYIPNGLIEGVNQLHAATAVDYQELVNNPVNPSENGSKLATNILRRFRFRRSVVSNKFSFIELIYRITIGPISLLISFMATHNSIGLFIGQRHSRSI